MAVLKTTRRKAARINREAASVIAVCVLLSLASVRPAHAFGCKGHQTIALLAEKHLTPAVAQAALALLAANPIDPQLKRFCGSSGLDAFADAATWADDERTVNRATAPWHFIDIPLGASRDQVSASCGAGGCVTQAIQDQLAVLKDSSAAGPKRADALRFIIHFVGDLHQPLHATTNADRGGNCVPVTYFKRTPHLASGSYSPNLHHLWDTEILERHMEGADPEEYAGTLDASFKDQFAGWQQAGIQLEDWAWETHQHAIETVYGSLPKTIAPEPNVPVNACTDDSNIGDRMLHKHIVLGATYQDEAAPVVDERLAAAGIRLAMVLSQVFNK
jgi:hypothetical protein